jgi:hypothetical protein
MGLGVLGRMRPGRLFGGCVAGEPTADIRGVWRRFTVRPSRLPRANTPSPPALTPETRGILGDALFDKLARDGALGGVLINAGRRTAVRRTSSKRSRGT